MKKYSIFAAVAILMATACSKERQTPNTSFGAKAADIMAKYGAREQTFTGNASTGFVVTGEKGIKLTIPAGAFKDSATGAPFTGTVTIKLTEILSKKDILLSGPMTESNGQLLISGGELNVRATGDGKPLIPGDSAIEVAVPMVMRAGDMNLFVQAPRKMENSGMSPEDYPNTWVPAPYAPFGMGAGSYIFDLPAFTWVNCDRFYSDPAPKTTITVSPDFQDTENVSDLQVMLVFSDITTVITLPFNYELMKFQSYASSLPIGKEGELVILGKDAEGYIEFGTQHITIAADQHIDIKIARSTEATVKAFLDMVQ